MNEQTVLTAGAVPSERSLRRDFSVSALAAGFLAVLVSYSGPLIIFFQAAQSAGVGPEMVASWVWGISIGAALSGIFLSYFLKVPVVTAWSAPGTALLVSLFPSISLNEAVGAYLVAAAVIFMIGISGSFDKILHYIPKGIAAGMMAGILFQFGANAFKSAGTQAWATFGMLFAYLVFKRFLPRYCMVLVLLVGVGIALALGSAPLGSAWALRFTLPQFIEPVWSWSGTLSLALPLVLVSITGQFLPGMAILRGAGYSTPARPIIAVTSLTSLLVACFGGITIVIAAITAAICTSKEAHEDPARRYVAGMANGLFYLIGGCFSASIVALFAVLPRELIAVLAGLALIGAITANLLGTLAEAEHREASVITFLATASGMSFLGLGSAFWGVVLGGLAYLILHHAGVKKPA